MQEFSHEYAYHWFFYPTSIEKGGGIWPIRSGCNVAKPNFKIGPRIINYYSLHFVLGGEGEITLGESKNRLRSGDLFCLFPNQTHQYITDPDNSLELFWLAIDGKQASSLLNRIGLTEHSYHIPDFITIEITNVIDELIKQFKEMGKDDEFIRLSLIYKLFHSLSIRAKEKNLTPITSGKWIQLSKQYMDMHFADGITVNDVAKYIGIHRSHFTTRFTSEIGVSPSHYLLALKMKKASAMISDRSFTITEIAFSLGYSDLYSFSKVFKKYTGVSPKQFLAKKKG
ncbi:AraC family transcriptional regulator [Robertmurraya yapensis]|uniref:AraC family transcriptional regulator n=2 Tax=Bacillaceae TaxID=186817 RepID=A0A431W8Z1_9BACI|nr:AraC family transcriptional regulator [Bacillus yapensis]RTR31950.1 AraC family transcriptional regulator [Bacillus yapensis]TKS95964.1 helix-turn-helix domain-containing protein [Bacillus yapensis]